MPGATTARLVFFDAAIDWKLSMMPQTVPNRPTNGAVEPTVARKLMNRSMRSISRPTATFITRSMRCCRLARMLAVPSSPLAALRRHSRIAAAKTALIGSAGRWPTRSYKSSSEPPDQKVSSKLAAACCNRRSRVALSKMTAHDQNEASSSRNITILTMASDCRNNSKTERVGATVPGSAVVAKDCIDGGLLWRELDDLCCGCGGGGAGQGGAQLRRHAARPAVVVDAGDQHVEIGQHFGAATDRLAQRQGGAGDPVDAGLDAERIVEPRRAAVFDIAAPHRKHDAGLRPHPAVVVTEAAQHLGAAALGEFQIVGVVDDPGRVGVLVIDPQRHPVRRESDRVHRPALPVGTTMKSITLRAPAAAPPAGRAVPAGSPAPAGRGGGRRPRSASGRAACAVAAPPGSGTVR